MFAPAMAMQITGNTLPRKTGVENIERSVFNLEAVTAKRCDGKANLW
jgi:hypothetical protein